MKIDLEKKVGFRTLGDVMLLVFLPVICVGGVSYFPYMLREPLIYLTALLSIFYLISADAKLRLTPVNVLYFLFLVYVGVSLSKSYAPDATMELLVIYACAFPLLFLELEDRTYCKILDIFYIIAIIIAISIIISVPIYDCMNRFFWPIINPGRAPHVTEALRKELSEGLYSGFAREKGEAAFIMNIGIASCLSRFFSRGKLNSKEIFSVVLMILALLLTGKRMMLIIAVVVFCVMMLCVRMNGKAGKFVLITIVAVAGFLLILMFIPTLANTFIRFTDSENMDSFGNRNILWEYTYMMIEKFWLFGAGFGTYNDFAYDNGLRSGAGKWEYYGHNIYYEGLGELGIVGCIFLFGFFVVAFVKTFSLIHNKNLSKNALRVVTFSFYVQLMMLIYGVTGNPIYTPQFIITEIFSIGMAMSVYNKTPKITKEKL